MGRLPFYFNISLRNGIQAYYFEGTLSAMGRHPVYIKHTLKERQPNLVFRRPSVYYGSDLKDLKCLKDFNPLKSPKIVVEFLVELLCERGRSKWHSQPTQPPLA